MTARSAAALGRAASAAAVAAALTLLAACSGDNSSSARSSAPTATSAAPTSTASSASTTAGRPATSAAPTSAASTAPPTTPAPTTTAVAVADLGAVKVGLTKVADASEPIYVTSRPGDSTTLYVAQRGGQLLAIRPGQAPVTVLDIANQISSGGERGFLGFAFAPDGSPKLYVDYTDRNGDTNVDEYGLTDDGRAVITTKRRVLFQKQPYPNHNGGELLFGPDGYLYIGLGDGGSGGDPQRNGQNLGTWLGKILRIDPKANGDQPYTVPPDNPFVGTDGAKPEIWAYGLRNPWRFAFDAATKDLWIGDVGQGAIEEIDHVTYDQSRGANFGWSAFEGSARYNQDQPTDDAIGPIYEYQHSTGGCSVTGGVIYRGNAIPALRGAFLFSDLCKPGVRAVAPGGEGEANEADLLDGPSQVVSFGTGPDGEVYVCSFGAKAVYRLTP